LFSTLGAQSVVGIPYIALVALASLLLAGFFLSRMTIGRAAYAIGGNREAARVSGISITRVKVTGYVLAGLFAAIGGFVLTGREESANALMGSGLELQSIVTGVSDFWEQVIDGLVIIGVVALDQWRRRVLLNAGRKGGVRTKSGGLQ
jgi:ribose transport system permease protein